MRTRKTDKLTEVNREKDTIWNQIGLSKFKFKLRVKKLQFKAAQVIVEMARKVKQTKNCFKCTQQFLKERTDTDLVG